MTPKTKEGVTVKVGQVYQDPDSGVHMVVKCHHLGIVRLEETPDSPVAAICIAHDGIFAEEGWKLISEPQ